ncbi:hypothetical protein V2H45_23150 [Tumidithrix elongata RA019]|uniref:Uncharacterized protein n=1 Tax=Tumidithrix elongata BACA0141 TaxID=2716417 RepID=A0AAW9Q542_9CYAN|nr:hypothetical protein [Tumidithrix elongata RA019]
MSIAVWIILGISSSIGFLFLLPVVSGWGRMHKKYRTSQSPPSIMSHMNNARVGWVGFRGTLNIGVSSQGLYLSTFILFRPFLPPLLIPWSEVIRVKKKDGILGHFYYLSINTKPITVMRLPQAPLTSVSSLLEAKVLDGFTS